MSDSRREARGARRETGGARFDDAIDRAVREMLDVEPPAGLRGRVLDAIDTNSAGSAVGLSTNSVVSAFRRKDNFRRKIVWGAVPLAAAAALVLAVLAPWQSPPSSNVTPASREIARVEPPPVVAPPAASQAAEPPGTRTVPLLRSTPPIERQPSPRAVEDRTVVAAVAPDDNATVIDPLAAIAPIVAAGTHPADIAPKEIAISPMAPIAQLQIAPLSPPERRN